MFRLILCVAFGAFSLSSTAVNAGGDDTSALLTQLRASNESTRLHAIDVLGEREEATPGVLKALTAELKSGSAAIRAHAAHALGHLGVGAQPAVEALAPLIVDRDPDVRRMAVRAWARIRPAPSVSVPLLSSVLKNSDPALRTEALDILADIGKPAVPALARHLQNDRTVYWSCMVLAEIGPDAAEAVPALGEVLTSSQRPEVRREAALALGSIGPASKQALPALIEALGDKDAMVVSGAAFALGRIGPDAKPAEASLAKSAASPDLLLKMVATWAMAKIEPQNELRKQAAVSQLAAALNSKQPRLRNAAVRGLIDLKPAPEAVLPATTAALHDADEGVAADALQVLAVLGKPAIPALVDALKREELRPMAARILGHMGPGAKAASPALSEIARTDKNVPARCEALLALGTIGADAAEAIPAAAEALRDPDDDVCYAACYALGKIGKPAIAVASTLRQKCGDANGSAALAAAWAIARIDPDSPETARVSVPVLIKGLADSEPRLRAEAASSLQFLGPLAKDAIPALQNAAADDDPTVRAAAAEALKAVGGHSPAGK